MAVWADRRGGRFKQWLAAGALLGAALAAQDPGLPDELARAWKASGLPGSSLSPVVTDLGGQPMVSLNANEPRHPHPVMKLVTHSSDRSHTGPKHDDSPQIQSHTP